VQFGTLPSVIRVLRFPTWPRNRAGVLRRIPIEEYLPLASKGYIRAFVLLPFSDC
jgi:hypothetical protein